MNLDEYENEILDKFESYSEFKTIEKEKLSVISQIMKDLKLWRKKYLKNNLPLDTVSQTYVNAILLNNLCNLHISPEL